MSATMTRLARMHREHLKQKSNSEASQRKGLSHSAAQQACTKAVRGLQMLSATARSAWRTLDKLDQPIFVEADAERFRYIVDWYRYGRIHLPECISMAEMRRECAFYQLPDTVEISTDSPTFADAFAVKLKAKQDVDDAAVAFCKAAVVDAFLSNPTDATGKVSVNYNIESFVNIMRTCAGAQGAKITEALGAYASEHGCKCDVNGALFTLSAKETK
eukprot:1536712-Amphidinium_carterae.1